MDCDCVFEAVDVVAMAGSRDPGRAGNHHRHRRDRRRSPLADCRRDVVVEVGRGCRLGNDRAACLVWDENLRQDRTGCMCRLQVAVDDWRSWDQGQTLLLVVAYEVGGSDLVVGSHGPGRNLDMVDEVAGGKHRVVEVDLEEAEVHYCSCEEGMMVDLCTCRSAAVDEVCDWNKAVGHHMEVFWKGHRTDVEADDCLVESHHSEWPEGWELVAVDLAAHTRSYTVDLRQVPAKGLFHPEVQVYR